MLRTLANRVKERWREYRVGGSLAFDPEYYRQQLSEHDNPGKGRRKLWKHYLREGAFRGLNPSAEFQSDWYLQTYPDVADAGLNPLVHYELFGRKEGRAPFLGARVHLQASPPLDQRTWWYFRLWGGFEHLILPELRRHAGSGNEVAQWLLAEWEFAHGEVEGAFARVEALSGPGGPKSACERNAWAKCETLLGKGGAAIEAEPWYQVVKDASGKQHAAVPAGTASPLVSVVVPAFNAARHLPRALDGLLAQSWRNLEVIVVDDASADNTPVVARRYAEKDARVHYVPNERNLGAYPTRNRGMRMARGDFVTVHDADDWSFPHKIERQIFPLLENEALAATGSVWVRMTEDGRAVGSWMLAEPFLEPNHSAWLIRRSALERVGLWDEVNVAADTEFLWRLEHHYGHRALMVVSPQEPLSLALSDEGSLTRAKATHVRTVFYGLRRLYREASSWWHRQSGFRPVLDAERPFPVPLGNLKRPPLTYDAVFAANFAVEGDALKRVLQALDRALAEGKRLCLLHWPDFDAWHGNAVADEVFERAQVKGLNFAHAGLTIYAPEVILQDSSLWAAPPTQTVRIEGLRSVVSPEGVLCTPQEALVAYFERGGVEHEPG